jgi:hypothetical protein
MRWHLHIATSDNRQPGEDIFIAIDMLNSFAYEWMEDEVNEKYNQ